MISEEIRQKFLTFFEKRGHKIIPSASLVPADYGDEGTLFTTAGMQPLIPYLLGRPHPAGARLVDVQKCVRTGDIEDVGDNRHLTFFEMMGNWSIGDSTAENGIGAGYFKQESINWSLEFLTSKEEGLGLDPKRFYVTIFRGEDGLPRDEEAIKIWQAAFAQAGLEANIAGEDEVVGENIRIIPLGKEDNFWIAGATGPCGGDTEIFYDTRPTDGPLVGKFGEMVDSFRLIEVWNNVFMEYEKMPDGSYKPLKQKNVDTGMGLERTTAVLNNVGVFQTDIFAPILAEITAHSNQDDEQAKRIIADHLRTAVFMLASGVGPANTDRGYILRRIIRRLVRYSDKIGATDNLSEKLVDLVVAKYENFYPELATEKDKIIVELKKEEEKFRQTLAAGIKIIDKEFAGKLNEVIDTAENMTSPLLTGEFFFNLYQTYGIPLELGLEEVKNRGLKLVKGIEEKLKTEFGDRLQKHQELSRAGADQKFKGGLASESKQVVRYHTATHLLQAALKEVLGPEVAQRGSNITDERLRFDFAYPAKLTDDQKNAVENLVNEKIKADLPMNRVELPKTEAEKTGATHLFGEKYGETVTVYYTGDDVASAWSKEFCGGPHVSRTGELGHFKIKKEEAIAAGVRRIKAVLE
ncbi:MAG TPA: alanine--tRNA ligase [Candidatus Paceibacterota bacterium]|jgi:alanyl-tRNA synthetase|nr:alanine--tRNA ligase [Candidatus Paceibacterota bacterium]HPB60350.1 alanine--tRNA ligase [Candidatus Paceibacterota bacterium]HPI24525.1 alanine--tRNA ligase [Candidatus Paceibacterota bacterium]HPN89307.1 alanine--tRNA ligase [Candidatus Paceibacterota bacterium]HPV33597.1 alanine--tRNA ligase [Candidatus Paceibacterota bacterium]